MDIYNVVFNQFFIWYFRGKVVVAPRINIFSAWESYALVYFLYGGLLGKYKDVFAIAYSNKITTLLVGASLVGLWDYGIIFMNMNHAYYDIVTGGYTVIYKL